MRYRDKSVRHIPDLPPGRLPGPPYIHPVDESPSTHGQKEHDKFGDFLRGDELGSVYVGAHFADHGGIHSAGGDEVYADAQGMDFPGVDLGKAFQGMLARRIGRLMIVPPTAHHR
jgi:hypothetical protein